ncbi:MAG: tandem-95 repeat protein, partial [Bacteroidetes bacterium]|nr:tandem-95 repeat protein [Bacteroidota bacterium]
IIDTASTVVTVDPTNGTATVNADGSVTYTPEADFVGTDVFEYAICDTGMPVLCDTALVTIVVTPVPDTAYFTLPEDSMITVCTDTITNLQDAVSTNLCGLPAHGTANETIFPCVEYIPEDDYFGNDTICITTCNSDGVCDTSIIIITVTPVNDPPVAVDDAATTDEDTPVDIDVTDNDYDIDGPIDETSVTIVTDPENGTVDVDPVTGVVTYTPEEDFVGIDTFVYEVCDTGMPVLCDIAEVVVTVQPTPDTTYTTTPEDTPLTVCTDSLTNLQGNITTVTICGGGDNGSTIPGDLPCVTYTPDEDYYGLDTVCVITCVGTLCDTTIIIIDVTPVNDPPIAEDDYAVTDEDTPVDIDVTDNDYDIDGPIDETSVTIVTDPENGTVDVDPVTGVVTYTPEEDFVGIDTFLYSVCDTGTPVLCDVAQVVVIVQPTPDTTYVSSPEDEILTVCTDSLTNLQGGIINVNICGDGQHGDAEPSTLPCVDYTPDENYNGMDTICILTCSPDGICDTTIVIIEVTPVNDPPVAVDDSEHTPEDVPVIVDVLENDYDIDGELDTTSVVVTDQPTNGTATANDDGTITYTPDEDFIGIDTFQYQVCDDGVPVLCDTAQVVIYVGPQSDTIYVALDEDTQITMCTDSVAQIPGPIITTAACGDPEFGTITVLPSLCIEYTPDENYNGPDTICVINCNDAFQCDTTIIIITVDPVNDQPDANDDYAVTDYVTPVDIDVVANDNDDIDGGEMDPTSVTVITDPVNGTVVNNGDGTVTYTPVENFIGTDSFDYVVCDLGIPLPSLCDTATVYVTVQPTSGDDCFIPQSFSPNGDGLYDFFEIPCAEFFPDMEVIVYNRWGDQIFQSEIGYQNDWNGFWDRQAQELPDGTYYWIVKFHDGISSDRAGYVYILR